MLEVILCSASQRPDFQHPCIGGGSGSGKTTFMRRCVYDIKGLLNKHTDAELKALLVKYGLVGYQSGLGELRRMFDGELWSAVSEHTSAWHLCLANSAGAILFAL